MPQITLPDGSVRQFDQARFRSGCCRRYRSRGSPRRRSPARSTVAWSMPAYVIEDDAEVAIVTGRDEEALELLRHDAAHVMAQAVQELYPGTQVTIGPGDRGRVLLRFRPRRAVYAGRPRGHRGAHARDRQARPADRARGARSRYRRSRPSPTSASIQGRDHRRQNIAEGRGSFDLSPGRLVRRLPRAAPAVHRQAWQWLQGHEGGRRLLARRFEERDAAAYLRHGLAGQEAAQGIPAPPRGGGKARSSQAWPPARPVPPARRGAGHRCSGTRRAGRCSTC